MLVVFWFPESIVVVLDIVPILLARIEKDETMTTGMMVSIQTTPVSIKVASVVMKQIAPFIHSVLAELATVKDGSVGKEKRFVLDPSQLDTFRIAACSSLLVPFVIPL